MPKRCLGRTPAGGRGFAPRVGDNRIPIADASTAPLWACAWGEEVGQACTAASQHADAPEEDWTTLAQGRVGGPGPQAWQDLALAKLPTPPLRGMCGRFGKDLEASSVWRPQKAAQGCPLLPDQLVAPELCNFEHRISSSMHRFIHRRPSQCVKRRPIDLCLVSCGKRRPTGRLSDRPSGHRRRLPTSDDDDKPTDAPGSGPSLLLRCIFLAVAGTRAQRSGSASASPCGA